MAIPVCYPQGRLTLTTGVPVLISDVTAATTVFYTPYKGNNVPIFNPSLGYFVSYTFSELSQTLADTTKAPAATALSSVYDLFLALDPVTGNPALYRGPLWTSDTARSAGTTLVRRNGFLVNAVAITNGPAEREGLYVGSFRTNASNQIDMMFFPATADGGTQNRLFLWNMYNRVPQHGGNRDGTGSYTYTVGTWRDRVGNANARTTFLAGIAEEHFLAIGKQYSQNSTNSFNRAICVSYDVSNAYYIKSSPGRALEAAAGASGDVMTAFLVQQVTLGVHYVTSLEISAAGGTATWYGDNTSNVVQSQVLFFLRM